jgi:hypothetical protein
MEELIDNILEDCTINLITVNDITFRKEAFNTYREFKNICVMFIVAKDDVVCNIEYVEVNGDDNDNESATIYFDNNNCDRHYLLNALLKCGVIGGYYFKDVMDIICKNFTYTIDKERNLLDICFIFDKLKTINNTFLMILVSEHLSYDDMEEYVFEIKNLELKKKKFKKQIKLLLINIKINAAITIQKYYRSWNIRKKYAWNPYTKLGKYYCMKDYNNLIK